MAVEEVGGRTCVSWIGGRSVDGADVAATDDLLRFGGISNKICESLFPKEREFCVK
jgi:hypothetical protein